MKTSKQAFSLLLALFSSLLTVFGLSSIAEATQASSDSSKNMLIATGYDDDDDKDDDKYDDKDDDKQDDDKDDDKDDDDKDYGDDD